MTSPRSVPHSSEVTHMAQRAKAKRAKSGSRGLTGVCKTLADAIKKCKKDIVLDNRAIDAQEALIQRLMSQGAKPAIVKQAREHLKVLNGKLESDEGQLSAFEDEFAAECRP